MSSKPDFCTRHGAELLARRVERYWLALGYNIRARASDKGCGGDAVETIYPVISNIGPTGYPPKIEQPKIEQR